MNSLHSCKGGNINNVHNFEFIILLKLFKNNDLNLTSLFVPILSALNLPATNFLDDLRVKMDMSIIKNIT